MTPSFYVGPEQARVVAATWEDIVSSAQAGLFDENQWAELKEAVPASSKEANLELARDLASLAVDGGVLILGVQDRRGAAGEVVGVENPDQLRNRISQVAAGTVSPPLSVTFATFATPEHDRKVLVVTVHASAGAPHMVDGRYWGRSADGKRVLHDIEVRRIWSFRSAELGSFEERLRQLVDEFDPIPPGDRAYGHYYLLAEPMARPFNPPVGTASITQLVRESLNVSPNWSPSLELVNREIPHPHGLAASTLPTSEWTAEHEEFLASVLLTEASSVQVATGFGTRRFGPRSWKDNEPDQRPIAISVGHVVELTYTLTQLCAHLSARHLAYEGTWRLGIYLDRLRGLLTTDAHQGLSFAASMYPTAEYLRSTTAPAEEMGESTKAVVERLLHPFLRTTHGERYLHQDQRYR